MPRLAPIKLDDGTTIYIEATDDVDAPAPPEDTGGERPLVSKGDPLEAAVERFASVQDTLRSWTNQALNAFREVAAANVDKVTLEFGLKVGGEAGIPYVTKGTAESNLKITVECSFKEPNSPM